MNTYQVQKGDTLSGIASKYGTSIQNLMSLNPSITDPNMIQAGASLNLPQTTTPTPTPTDAISSYSAKIANVPSFSTSGSTGGAVPAPNQSLIPLANPYMTPIPDSKSTAAQDQITAAADKAKKFYESTKGIDTTKKTAGDIRTDYSAVKPDPTPTPTPSDQSMGIINPILANYFTQATAAISKLSDYSSLSAQFQPQMAEISGLDTQMVNMSKVINGSEQDIRNEIQNAGGFATESQIQNLVVARNKNLILNYNSLVSLRQSKVDELNMQIGLSKDDRDYAMKVIDDQLNISGTLADMQTKMQATTIDTFNNTVKNAGGYTNAVAGLSPAQKTNLEVLNGLPSGALSDPTWLARADQYNASKIALEQAKAAQAQSAATSGLQESLIASRNAMTLSRTASAVNAVVKTLFPTSQANPINTYAVANQWVGKLEEGYKLSTDPTNNAKNVSDLELIDAAVKINNGGQQITETQVNTLLSGAGLPQKASVAGGKLVGISALLTDDQRKTILDLAENNLQRQQLIAQAGVDQINKRLTALGFPPDQLISDPLQASDYLNLGSGADVNSINFTSDTGNTYQLPNGY